MSDLDSVNSEGEVLAANAKFYEAFSEGDIAAMTELWAARLPLACLHPGAPLLLGRKAVLDGWRQILGVRPTIVLRCQRAKVQFFGNRAIVYCYEGAPNQPCLSAATNVFVREDGVWRMVHHHAGVLSKPIPPEHATSHLN